MNTSNQDCKTSETNTKTQERLSMNIDTESLNEPMNTMSLSQANKLLDRIKEGFMTPSHLINEALKVTGDL
jgi:hypothetical protein